MKDTITITLSFDKKDRWFAGYNEESSGYSKESLNTQGGCGGTSAGGDSFTSTLGGVIQTVYDWMRRVTNKRWKEENLELKSLDE